MEFQTIEFARHGPVATITLNRPDKLNAINKTMLDELNMALDRAEQMIAPLKIARLVDGVRGNPPGDRRALIETIVRLSGLAFALREVISETDINPVIVNQTGACAVDGLVSVFDSSQARSNLSNREMACA